MSLPLETKPDFQKTLDRFEAWWQCEVIDRPPVAMTCASGATIPRPKKQHASLRERWFDMDFCFQEIEAQIASRKWVADSVPKAGANLGPEILTTLYGSELEFTPDSSWSKPIAHSSRDVIKLKPNLDNPYWNWIREFTRQSIERGRDKWITSVTDLHPNADLLAGLREPQELLLELMDDYDGVKAAIAHLAPLWDIVYEDLARPILAAGMPVMGWIASPHMGRGCVIQADFICMLSPKMFQEIFLPALEYEANYLDRSIYHLDGPNALQHLDALLGIRKLNAIQWVCGAGNGPATRWIDVYKRIQAAGKGMQILCESIEDALGVAEQVKPQGCFFSVGGDYSEEQINQFLHRLEKWTATGKL